ncbi:M48 family metallopeptidase [Paenibacillus lactis]|uniref:M48 family metallopeptidase n=1 Tax=Paenibacillus TaxID=44249 RepID=UPI0011A63EB3|nr:SprT family zinc-dependent metalloprotease [Paenibacillus sp. IHBB 10380]
MPDYQYGNTTIEYTLEYKPDAKDIIISVDWIDGVKIIIPPSVDDIKLQEVLNKKSPWIMSKWYEFDEIDLPPNPKEYVSGEKFLYLGRSYRLKVQKDATVAKSSLLFQKGRFIATVPINTTQGEVAEQLRSLFVNWYMLHGQAKLLERLKIYVPKMGVSPSKLQLKHQKMRWGSCAADQSIYINWRIMMAPMKVIDYVLVHEMGHLKYPNHSSDFWQFVRSILPDYDERKEWLRIHGPLLTL